MIDLFNFLMEVEEINQTSAPKLSKKDFLALTTQEQINHTKELSKTADAAYQKFLELQERKKKET